MRVTAHGTLESHDCKSFGPLVCGLIASVVWLLQAGVVRADQPAGYEPAHVFFDVNGELRVVERKRPAQRASVGGWSLEVTESSPSGSQVTAEPSNATASPPQGLGSARAAPDLERTLGAARGTGDTGRWRSEEVEAKIAACARIIRRTGAEVEALPPLAEGSCGSAAPMLLKSLGKRHKVVFSPAATVNCSMIAALSDWIEGGVQPLAQKHLGARVVEVNVMSDYSCRGVYGRAGARLSEHAFANALDIGGFVTSDRRQTLVLDHWGPNGRDVVRYAQARERVRAREQGGVATQPSDGVSAPDVAVTAATTAGSTNVQASESGIVSISEVSSPGGVGNSTAPMPPLAISPGPRFPAALGLVAPSRLGGPTTQHALATAPELFRGVDRQRRRFLREAHVAACKVFRTVLGPELDETHRNHLHVDLNKRNETAYCR
ncbi:MAG: extensin family protein [Hyphomicrobiaceae bacterium]